MGRRLSRAGDVVRLRAENPGPLTLSGTNTWIVGRDPAYVVDPGPALAGAHRAPRGGARRARRARRHRAHPRPRRPLRGGRRDCASASRARWPRDAGEVDVKLAEGTRFGPFEALATPGHAPDHFALISGRACFTGDAVLGEGSVFIAPDPGALAGYLDGLEKTARARPGCAVPGSRTPDLGASREARANTSSIVCSASACCLGRSPRVAARHPSCSTPPGRMFPAELRPVAAVSLARPPRQARGRGSAARRCGAPVLVSARMKRGDAQIKPG